MPRFERCLRVLLARHADAWSAAKAFTKLRETDLVSLRALYATSLAELAETLSPLRQPQRAAKQLKQFADIVVQEHRGSLTGFFSTPIEALQRQLSAINGLGQQTIDRFLAEAGDLPVYVVELSAERVFKRHGWLDFEADRQALKQEVQAGLPVEAEAYRYLHDLLDAVGRDYCRKQPLCEECPLQPWLPEGGPAMSESEFAS